MEKDQEISQFNIEYLYIALFAIILIIIIYLIYDTFYPDKVISERDIYQKENKETIIIKKPGGFNALKLNKHEIGELKEGHIIIKTEYAGVNFSDILVRMGTFPAAKKRGYPIIPGFEFSGIVERTPPNSKFHRGEEVFGVTEFGGYSHYIYINEDLVFKTPKEINQRAAGGLGLTALTAYYATEELFILNPKSRILVHSPTGGLGCLLVQLLKARSECACVVGVVGSNEKVARAREIGCHYVIDKSKGLKNLWKEAEGFSPHGYDVIFDPNGATTLKESFGHLGQEGKLVVYGFSSLTPRHGRMRAVDWVRLLWNLMKIPKFDPLLMTSSNRSVFAFDMVQLLGDTGLVRRAMDFVVEKVVNGRVILGDGGCLVPIWEAGRAHQILQGGKSMGKIILKFEDLKIE